MTLKKSSVTSEKEFSSSHNELRYSFPIVLRTKPYISVGLGWHGLLEELFFKMEKIILRSSHLQDWDNIPYIFDVKEKYGGLRITVYGFLEEDPLNEEIEKLVDEYEERSLRVCEVCSKEGRPTTSGWIKTLCVEHWDGH